MPVSAGTAASRYGPYTPYRLANVGSLNRVVPGLYDVAAAVHGYLVDTKTYYQVLI